MLNWIKSNKKEIIRGMFLVPIILVMIISISHVVSWYDLSNPVSWAIYLSIAIEIAAMSSIAAASVRIKGGVWFVFAIVTLIQFIGNIFFSYKDINVNSQEFKDWVELTQPVFDALGSDTSDMIAQRRWLALLSGGLLPLISLASLHFFIKYGGMDDEPKTVTPTNPIVPTEPTVIPEGPATITNLDPPTPSEDVYVIERPVEDVKSEEVKIEEPIIEEIKDESNNVTIESIFPTENQPKTETQSMNIEETLRENFKKKVEGRDRWG